MYFHSLIFCHVFRVWMAARLSKVVHTSLSPATFSSQMKYIITSARFEFPPEAPSIQTCLDTLQKKCTGSILMAFLNPLNSYLSTQRCSQSNLSSFQMSKLFTLSVSFIYFMQETDFRRRSAITQSKPKAHNCCCGLKQTGKTKLCLLAHLLVHHSCVVQFLQYNPTNAPVSHMLHFTLTLK